LLSLFDPHVRERIDAAPAATDDPAVDRDAPLERAGNLVVVIDDHERLLKAFHSVHGRVTDLDWTGPHDLARLRDTYAARRVVCLREGVMDEMAERLALRLSRGDDYVTQWLALARIFREMVEAGLVHVHPRPLANFPIPGSGTVRRALDLVLPDERSMVVTLWEDGRTWTSAALRRRAGSIDFVAGPDHIARWTGPLGGDWRRDHRVVVDAVSRKVAPVHVGVFGEVGTFRELLRQPDPGAWARAVAVRDVILHPTPPYAAVAVGADAVRGVASITARLLGGIDPLSVLAPVAELVRNRVGDVGSISAVLGFNPLAALAAMLRREDDDSARDVAERERNPDDDGL
jgi:hypothetical protein